MYADDIVLLGDTVLELQRKSRVLEEFCEKWGMEVNLTKKKELCNSYFQMVLAMFGLARKLVTRHCSCNYSRYGFRILPCKIEELIWIATPNSQPTVNLSRYLTLKNT